MEFDDRNFHEVSQQSQNCTPQKAESDTTSANYSTSQAIPNNDTDQTRMKSSETHHPSACATPIPGARRSGYYSNEPWLVPPMMMDSFQSPIPNDAYDSDRRIPGSESKVNPHYRYPWPDPYGCPMVYPVYPYSAPPKSRMMYNEMDSYFPYYSMCERNYRCSQCGPSCGGSQPNERKKPTSNKSSRARRRLGFDTANHSNQVTINENSMRGVQENLENIFPGERLKDMERLDEQSTSELEQDKLVGDSFSNSDTYSSFYENNTLNLSKSTSVNKEDEMIHAKDINDLIRQVLEDVNPSIEYSSECQPEMNSTLEPNQNSYISSVESNACSEDFVTQLLLNNEKIIADKNAIFEVSYLPDGIPCVSLKVEENGKNAAVNELNSFINYELQPVQSTEELISSTETPLTIPYAPTDSIQELVAYFSDTVAPSHDQYAKEMPILENQQAEITANKAMTDKSKDTINYPVDIEQVCKDLFDDLALTIFDVSASCNTNSQKDLCLPELNLDNDFGFSSVIYPVEATTQTELSYSLMKDSTTQTDCSHDLISISKEPVLVPNFEFPNENKHEVQPLPHTITAYKDNTGKENRSYVFATESLLTDLKEAEFQGLISNNPIVKSKSNAVSSSYFAYNNSRFPSKVIEKTTTIIVYDQGKTNVNQVKELTVETLEADESKGTNALTYDVLALDSPKALCNKNQKSAFKTSGIGPGKKVTFDSTVTERAIEADVKKKKKPKKKSKSSKKKAQPKKQETQVVADDTPEENIKLVEDKCRNRSNSRYLLRRLL